MIVCIRDVLVKSFMCMHVCFVPALIIIIYLTNKCPSDAYLHIMLRTEEMIKNIFWVLFFFFFS